MALLAIIFQLPSVLFSLLKALYLQWAAFSLRYFQDSTSIPFMSTEMFAFSALVLATINVVGGFAVTNRMLNMIAGKRGGK